MTSIRGLNMANALRAKPVSGIKSWNTNLILLLSTTKLQVLALLASQF